MNEPITINCSFPGGNAIVEAVEPAAGPDGAVQVRLRQDQRDSSQWWFYWQFEVRGRPGTRIRFTFTDGDVIGQQGPAVSDDGGRSWKWLGRACVDGTTFTDTIPAEARRYSFCIAYLERHLSAWLAAHPAAGQETLCIGGGGRDVELLRLGRQGSPRGGAGWLLATARHHACEAPGSYVLEGLMTRWLELAAADSDVPELLAVPFVDKAGVEAGDQGKNRGGHDHNRDYAANSRYPETAAIRDLVQRQGGLPTIMLDLHAPWIRGDHNEQIYLVGSPDPVQARRQRELVQRLAGRYDGPYDFRPDDMLPFGEAWNVRDGQPDQESAVRWFARAGTPLAATLEFPYAVVREMPVSPDGLRGFGSVLAETAAEFGRTLAPAGGV